MKSRGVRRSRSSKIERVMGKGGRESRERIRQISRDV